VLVAFSIAGLGALHLWAGEPRGGAGADVLAVALLRADVDREPDDAAARVRLARQQLSAGLQQEAEHTLAPLLRGDTELSRETADLSLEIAVSAWRALRPGTGARRAAAATAIARMEKLLAREADVPVLVDLARLANELGRPDLAASAAERAATLEPDSARAMSLGLAAVEAWRSADQGAQALRVAEVVAARFPSERAVLETAVTVALAQNDPVRARGFGE